VRISRSSQQTSLPGTTKNLTTSAPRHELICNTTPVRYFALTGLFHVLVSISGGAVLIPRQVLNPEEDTDTTPESLLSEIGRSEIFWSKRSRDAEAMDNWSRLRELRQRQDVHIIDLEDAETRLFDELVSPPTARIAGLKSALGAGEAAVIAVAVERGWSAAIDDAEARRILSACFTTRELLRRAVAEDVIQSPDAQIVYHDMLAKRYKGPSDLWD
jgi:predicted nucleic acid-binding protein